MVLNCLEHLTPIFERTFMTQEDGESMGKNNFSGGFQNIKCMIGDFSAKQAH